jgi:Heterokaryon incompatibility protein (HET)
MPFFFRSGIFFHQFLELCITSYPSPLDERAPLAAKLVLLVIAGNFEYVAASWLTGPYAAAHFLIFERLLGFHTDFESSQYGALIIFLVLSFGYRARSFARSASRQGRGMTLRSFATALFWHNPALLCHGWYRLWAYWTGTKWTMLVVPRFFWVLVAPTMEIGQMNLEKMERREMEWARIEGRENKMKPSSRLGLILIGIIVQFGPSMVIDVALGAQSWAYLSSVESDPEQGIGGTVIKVITKSYGSLMSLVRFLGTAQPSQRLGREASRVHAEISQFLLKYLSKGEIVLVTVVAYCVRLMMSFRADSYLSKGPGEADDREHDGQIRLLTIIPGSRGSPICCVLGWYDAAKMPSYTAVSYCWRSHQPSADKFFKDTPRQIVVNDQDFEVTKTAFEVLTHMRSNYRSRTIWIDAICIDQKNEDDKTRQLPLMPQIYQDAREVIVFLGPSKTAALATSLVNRAFVVNRLCVSDQTEYKYEIPTDAARALKRMLKRPWFQRVWIVQEVVKGRKVTIRYGDESLSWERFSWFAQSIQADSTLLSMLSDRIGHAGLIDDVNLRNVSLIRRFACVKDGSLSLSFYLLQMFRSTCQFESEKEHDIIYGILGLTRASSVYLTADYSLPPRKLYINVVCNLLEKSPPARRLDFLVHAGTGYGSIIEKLPSWAPDWSIKTNVLPFIGMDGGVELLTSLAAKEILSDAASLATFAEFDDGTGPTKSGYQHIPGPKTPHERAFAHAKKIGCQTLGILWDATPGTECSANLLLDDDILELQGYKVDRIRAVTSTTFPALTAEDWKPGFAVLSDWAAFVTKNSSGPTVYRKYPKTEPVGKAFCRFLRLGTPSTALDYTFRSVPEGFPNPHDTRHIENMWYLLTEGISSGRYHSITRRSPTNRPPEEEPEKVCENFTRILERTLRGRCFGVTEKGNFGLFLPGSKVGDSVVLFSGARVPFVVRSLGKSAGGEDGEDGENFELIGPANINGIMGGAGENTAMGKSDVFEPMRIR